MNLKRWIIGLSAALHACRSNDFDACIGRAEALWEALTLRGHGDKDKAEANPRDARDWHASLSAAQQKQFDAFWTAYGLKKGRNRACMRWYQMGELKAEELAHLLHAARREEKEWGGSYQRDNGQTRKFAEGWLSERRWEDHPKPPSPSFRHGLAESRHMDVTEADAPSLAMDSGNPCRNDGTKPVRTKEAAGTAIQQAQAALGRHKPATTEGATP